MKDTPITRPRPIVGDHPSRAVCPAATGWFESQRSRRAGDLGCVVVELPSSLAMALSEPRTPCLQHGVLLTSRPLDRPRNPARSRRAPRTVDPALSAYRGCCLTSGSRFSRSEMVAMEFSGRRRSRTRGLRSSQRPSGQLLAEISGGVPGGPRSTTRWVHVAGVR